MTWLLCIFKEKTRKIICAIFQFFFIQTSWHFGLLKSETNEINSQYRFLWFLQYRKILIKVIQVILASVKGQSSCMCQIHWRFKQHQFANNKQILHQWPSKSSSDDKVGFPLKEKTLKTCLLCTKIYYVPLLVMIKKVNTKNTKWK